MKRTDEHRPSAINPNDYEYVAQEYFGPGDWMAAAAERKIIQAHMQRTGGRYACVETTGNCMVCGSVNALYTILFYHAKSNTYVRMGQDCAAKCEMSGNFNSAKFRKSIEDAREAHAGKMKAQAVLADNNLSVAYSIYTSDLSEYAAGRLPYEVVTIRDIVSKLVKYGSSSVAQLNLLRNLLVKIEQRPALEAKRAAERASASDCVEGRQKLSGLVLKIAEHESAFGICMKMTVKHDGGFIVWGTVPSSFDCKVGDTIEFTATFTKSPNDSKFGFFKRPTNAVVLQKRWEAPTFVQVITFEPGSDLWKTYQQTI